MTTITGPDPIVLCGRAGHRYRIDDPFDFTGVPAVDARLASFPLAVFRPESRPARETPVVLALNGMSAPFGRLGPLVPALLDLGIACVLVETPFAGERSLTRRPGDILAEVHALVGRKVPITTRLVLRLFQAVARDIGTALRLVEGRYGMTDGRHALFGVSLGTLLCSYAFTRDGTGRRLLGTIGHADLALFARSYLPPLSPVQLRMLGQSAGPEGAFLALLSELASGEGEAREANPMTYVDRVGDDRCVRFLVGGADPVVRPADAVTCARRFPDGDCRVVPGLGHGGHGFEAHARDFLRAQLGDWAG